MKYFGKIGEFTIELLQYASDNDIKIFLQNCSKFLVHRKETEDMKAPSYYKKRLLNLLYEYIFAYCELKLHTKYLVVTEDNTQERQEEENYKYHGNGIELVTKRLSPLYLHLYALCECYQSYKNFFLREEKSKRIDLTQINKNKRNIFNLLINNYTENKFYYSFDKKYITKYRIISEKIEKDEDKKIEEHTEYKYSIKKYPRKNFNIQQKETSTLKSTEVKIIHDVIVKRLKQDYCKWCYPNPTNTTSNLCDRCIELSSEFKSLKENIRENEYNEYIASIRKINFNNIICNVKPIKNEDVKFLKAKRRIELYKIINNVETKIHEELNNTEESKTLLKKEYQKQKEYYKTLLKIIINIKEQISAIF